MKRFITIIVILIQLLYSVPPGPYSECLSQANDFYSSCIDVCNSLYDDSICFNSYEWNDPNLIQCLNSLLSYQSECYGICYTIKQNMIDACGTLT